MLSAQDAAKQICQTLRSHGYTAYFAGGFVRDLIMGIPSSDIDIATDALPEEIVALFPYTIPVGIQFGVVLVRQEMFHFEVATFRSDMAYEGGRRPTAVILKSTPQKDAERRDFTINGMFFDPETSSIFDYVGGRTDIAHKIIRTIGDPRIRFSEDRLRMIRAVRFQNRYQFSLDEETAQAIKQMSHTLLPAVSMERVYQELTKIKNNGFFSQALITLNELGLLSAIFPSFSQLSSEMLAAQLGEINALDPTMPFIVIIGHLLNDDDHLLDLVEYVKGSSEDKKWIQAYKETKRLLHSQQSTDHDWTCLFADDKKRACLMFLIHKNEENIHFFVQKEESLRFFIQRVKQKEPLICPSDLAAIGIQPGVIMGKLLQEAEKISINRGIIDKTTLLNTLKELHENDFKHS